MGQQALNFVSLASSPHTHNLLAVCLTLQRGRWHPLNPWPKLCKASEPWNLETDGTTHRETENHQDHTCPQAHTVITPCAIETLLTAFPVSQSSPLTPHPKKLFAGITGLIQHIRSQGKQSLNNQPWPTNTPIQSIHHCFPTPKKMMLPAPRCWGILF